MEFINFKIEDGIYFVVNGKHLDIHNDYDCLGFSYDFKKKQVIVSWTINQGDWVSKNLPSTLELSLREVTVVKTSERDPNVPFSEDDCVMQIGFAYSDINNDDFKNCLAPEQSDNFSLFALWFQGGCGLYVAAKSAELKFQ